jgi:hypothetical protein
MLCLCLMENLMNVCNPKTRRVFLLSSATSGVALSSAAHAQAMVDEKDAQSAALAYVAEAKKGA